jgi:hypothetical protein
LGDTTVEPKQTLYVNLQLASGTALLADSDGQGTIPDDDGNKFYVVDDASTDRTYRYATAGNTLGNSTRSANDSAPRGIAANTTGTTLRTVDVNKTVFVYNPSGGLLGSWTSGSLRGAAQLTGIATNGTDSWLVDKTTDAIYDYAGAASRRSGRQNASSSFTLASGNTNPQGIVTDGSSLWVVDDGASTDKVFKYNLTGGLIGSWNIDPANTQPTGITLNPNKLGDLWIVDSSTKKVYRYAGATWRSGGSQTAAASFALAAGDTNPQDIADPPASSLTPGAAPVSLAVTVPASLGVATASGRMSASGGIPSFTGPDARWAALVGGEMAKGTSALSLGSRSSNTFAAASDRVVAPWSELVGMQSGDLRTAVAPAILAGAGSEPGAADLLIDGLTAEDSQASASTTDSFFALLADQLHGAE